MLCLCSDNALLARSAVIQKEDEEGKVGVKIGKELMKVAGMALKANITRLGPKVLPLSEKLIFAGNYVARKVRIDTFLTCTCFLKPCDLTSDPRIKRASNLPSPLGQCLPCVASWVCVRHNLSR